MRPMKYDVRKGDRFILSALAASRMSMALYQRGIRTVTRTCLIVRAKPLVVDRVIELRVLGNAKKRKKQRRKTK